MPINLYDSNKSVQTAFKGFLIVAVIFLAFFAVNLWLCLQGKRESAYSALSRNEKEEQMMLQDTRVHNWSEVKKN